MHLRKIIPDLDICKAGPQIILQQIKNFGRTRLELGWSLKRRLLEHNDTGLPLILTCESEFTVDYPAESGVWESLWPVWAITPIVGLLSASVHCDNSINPHLQHSNTGQEDSIKSPARRRVGMGPLLSPSSLTNISTPHFIFCLQAKSAFSSKTIWLLTLWAILDNFSPGQQFVWLIE